MKHYGVLQLFMTVTNKPDGCDQLHRLHILENLQKHALNTETEKTIGELVLRCSK